MSVKSTCKFCGSSNEFHGAANAYSCHCKACGKNCAGEYYHERVINRVPVLSDFHSRVIEDPVAFGVIVGVVISSVVYFIFQFL